MRSTIVALALVVTALSATPAVASEEFRDKMHTLAQGVLKNTQNQAVTVGQFSPTGLGDTNSGPGIEGMLATELDRCSKGSVRPDARYEVKGDYALVPSKANPDLKEIKIAARIISKETAEELKDLRIEARIDGTNTIADILQVTASLNPEGSKVERNQELQRQAGNPAAYIHGPKNTLVSSSAKSSYGVELLVKPLKDHDRLEASSRPATSEKGLAFVDIQRDELYEVRLYNNSDHEVAASVSIDGLSMFHFSQDRKADGEPMFSHLIIAPKSDATVVGWHNSLAGDRNFLSFLVTGYGAGAVSQAGMTARGKVGVIHVQFSNCKPLAPGARSAAGNETGFGPPRKVGQQAVQYEIEPPHDFVSVRYTRPQE